MAEIDGRVLKTRSARILLLIYRCLGGIFYENNGATNNWKLRLGILLLKSIAILPASLCIINIVEHFVIRKEQHLNFWKILCWYAILPGIAVLNLVLDFHIYYLRNNFTNLIRAVDDYFRLPSDAGLLSTSQHYSKFDLRKWSFIACLVVGLSLVIDASILMVILVIKIKKFNLDIIVPAHLLPDFYPLPVPYILDERMTLAKFVLAHIVGIFIQAYSVTITFGLHMFSFVVVGCMLNSVISLTNVTHDQLSDLYLQMESSSLFHMGKTDPCLQIKCVMQYKEYFMHHRTLKKHLEDIRELIQFNYSLALVQTFFCTLVWGCMIQLHNQYPIKNKFRYKAGVIFFPVFLCLVCSCGKMCEDMCELILLEAYNVPWYYLTPSRRKIVPQILCFFQQPINFRGLKIYILYMCSWPRIMNMCYSIINTFRVIN